MNNYFFIDPCVINRVYTDETLKDLDPNIWSEYVIDLDIIPIL